MSQQRHLPRHWSLPEGRADRFFCYFPFRCWGRLFTILKYVTSLGKPFLSRTLLDFSISEEVFQHALLLFCQNRSVTARSGGESRAGQHVFPAGLAYSCFPLAGRESCSHYSPFHQKDTLNSLSLQRHSLRFPLPSTISLVSNTFSFRGDLTDTHLIQYWAPRIYLQVCCFYFRPEEGPKRCPLSSDSYSCKKYMVSLASRFSSQGDWRS